MPKYHLKI